MIHQAGAFICAIPIPTPATTTIINGNKASLFCMVLLCFTKNRKHNGTRQTL